MASIFEGFKTSIRNYMQVDTLPTRAQEKVKATYSKDYYDMDTISDIASTPLPEEESETK
jgi:hypothetical protein